MPRIVATPEELDARNGWWKWAYEPQPKVNVDSADKWLRPAGYVKDEVKRALRRAPLDKAPGWKVTRGRNRWERTRYEWKGIPLPLPSLAASSKRLARAALGRWANPTFQPCDKRLLGPGMPRVGADDETWTGPRAAEQYIKYRRAQLGLSNDLADPEMDALELQEVA